MVYVLDEMQVMTLILQWLGIGLGIGMVPIILLKISPGWAFFSAWVRRTPIILMKRQDGQYKPMTAKYDKGFYIADKKVFQPVTDGTDIGLIGGIPLGITSEHFGATLSPEKVGAIELWKKYGFSGMYEAELFDLYVRTGQMPEEDYEISSEVKVKDLYVAMQKTYNMTDPMTDCQKRFEEMKQKIPRGEASGSPVFWEEGKGLFAKVNKIVDYNAIRNFQLQYLRPDLVEAQIKAHVQAKLEEQGSAVNLVKYAGIGIMVFMVFIGAGILLKMLGFV